MYVENSPFGSNAESDDSNQWEVSDADLKGEKDADSSEKKDKPKRNLFETAKEKDKREQAELDEKKPSIFEALLGKDESDEADKKDTENTIFGIPVNDDIEPLVEATPTTNTDVAERFEEIVDDKIESVDQELVGSGEPTRVSELLADVELLENVAEKLDEGQDPVKAIDNATEEILENPMTDPDIVEMRQPTPDSLNVDFDNEDDELDKNSTKTTVSPPVVPPTRSTPPPPPPSPPIPPTGAMPTFGANTPPPSFDTYQPSPNTAPVNDPELVPMNDSFNRDPNTGRVIASGLLGYMIGRRGGRKRAEAKMQPIISEQEKQLHDISIQLERSEELVKRSVVAETEAAAKASRLEDEAIKNKDSIINTEEVILRAETVEEERKDFEERERKLEATLEAEENEKKSMENTVRAEEEFSRREEELVEVLQQQREKEDAASTAAIESLQLSNRVETEEEKRQEQAKVAAQVEHTAQEKVRLSEAKRGIDARRMTLSRVLEIAEFIPMRNSLNLRQMYEAKRIDAVSLRRIVNEYLHGGNFEKALEQSLEAVELRSELKHEIKQDNSMYTHPEHTAHSVVDGLIAATRTQDTYTEAAISDSTQNTQPQPQQKSHSQSDDTSMLMSDSSAIIIGVVAGILITILLLLYFGSA
jgi:hypothetical protein